MANPDSRPDPLRGAIAGVAAGLAAAFAMNQFQKLWPQESADKGDPATVKAANKASRTATGKPVPEPAKDIAGEAVHYGLGAALGVGYGILAEYWPQATAGLGTAFGAVTALALDEAAVPAMGLGEAPWKTPPATHAYGMISHIVFGLVTEGARRSLRAAL